MKYPFDYNEAYESLLSVAEIRTKLAEIATQGVYTVTEAPSDAPNTFAVELHFVAKRKKNNYPLTTIIFSEISDTTGLARTHVALRIETNMRLIWNNFGVAMFLLSMAWHGRKYNFNFSYWLTWLILLPFVVLPLLYAAYISYRFGKKATQQVRSLLEDQFILSHNH